MCPRFFVLCCPV